MRPGIKFGPLAETAYTYGALLSLLALLILAPASEARAHPHVFIESESEVLMNEKSEITGIRHRWLFDEQYTAFALVGMDTNKDGAFSQEELEPLAKENISSLHEFDYFTYLHQQKQALKLKDPINAELTYLNNELVLTFTLPLEKPISASGNPVKLAIYDPEFFIAFLDPKSKKSVELAATAPKACMYEKHRPTMDQTGLVEQRLGQPMDLTNEENQGAGALFAPRYVISCLAN